MKVEFCLWMHTTNNLRCSVERNRLQFSAGIFRKMGAFLLVGMKYVLCMMMVQLLGKRGNNITL